MDSLENMNVNHFTRLQIEMERTVKSDLIEEISPQTSILQEMNTPPYGTRRSADIALNAKYCSVDDDSSYNSSSSYNSDGSSYLSRDDMRHSDDKIRQGISTALAKWVEHRGDPDISTLSSGIFSTG